MMRSRAMIGALAAIAAAGAMVVPGGDVAIRQTDVPPPRRSLLGYLGPAPSGWRGGYLRHQNGSTPRDRRAAATRRNRLRAKGQHRKAVR